MSCYLICFVQKKQRFWKRIRTRRFHCIGASFFVTELPYTVNELMKERIYQRAVKRMKRVIRGADYVFAPQFPAFAASVGAVPEGGAVLVRLADRVLCKLMKNYALSEPVVGICDESFTEWSVQLMENVADVASGILVFTDRREAAAGYGERVFERTGTPVCFCEKPSQADVLFAVSEWRYHTERCGVDLWGGQNGKSWVHHAQFQFIGEAAELEELFGTVCDERAAAFLMQSGAELVFGKNIRFIGYTN